MLKGMVGQPEKKMIGLFSKKILNCLIVVNKHLSIFRNNLIVNLMWKSLVFRKNNMSKNMVPLYGVNAR